MPQRVICQECGKRLKASDNAAGKRVRCKCGAAVPVPPLPATARSGERSAAPEAGPAAPNDLLAGLESLSDGATAGATCPHCRAFLPSGAVLCTSCGLNLTTGQRMAVRVQAESSSLAPPDEAPRAKGLERDDRRGSDRAAVRWSLFAKGLAAAAIVAGIVYCYYEFSSYDPRAQGEAMLAQLKPGMTIQQVVDICGEPREVYRLATGKGLDAPYSFGEPVKAEYSPNLLAAYKDRIGLGFYFVYRFTPAGDHHVSFDGSGAMIGSIEIPNIFRQ